MTWLYPIWHLVCKQNGNRRRSAWAHNRKYMRYKLCDESVILFSFHYESKLAMFIDWYWFTEVRCCYPYPCVQLASFIQKPLVVKLPLKKCKVMLELQWSGSRRPLQENFFAIFSHPKYLSAGFGATYQRMAMPPIVLVSVPCMAPPHPPLHPTALWVSISEWADHKGHFLKRRGFDADRHPCFVSFWVQKRKITQHRVKQIKFAKGTVSLECTCQI